MFHVFLSLIFDAKIINYECERYITNFVNEEAIGQTCRDLAIFSKMFNKVVMCDFLTLL